MTLRSQPPPRRKAAAPAPAAASPTVAPPATPGLPAVALSRWENEGGSDAEPVPAAPGAATPQDTPASTTAQLMQLHVRVIALENLLVALLAEAPARQLALAREMAGFISPRPGFTPHPLTLRAADEMLSLVNRADRYPPPSPS